MVYMPLEFHKAISLRILQERVRTCLYSVYIHNRYKYLSSRHFVVFNKYYYILFSFKHIYAAKVTPLIKEARKIEF